MSERNLADTLLNGKPAPYLVVSHSHKDVENVKCETEKDARNALRRLRRKHKGIVAEIFYFAGLPN